MRTLTLLQPQRLVFGNGCFAQCMDYLAGSHAERIHIVSSRSLVSLAADAATQLQKRGCHVTLSSPITGEPTLEVFALELEIARAAKPDCVLGLGGGSALDLAKLLAALVYSDQRVEDTFGIGLLAGRECPLVCVPATSGTGSEVSPNAILLDESARLKKGVISQWLVPDAAFVDPELTLSVPPQVTAATGLDALTHCIEAYTNRFAHPIVDVYALQGVALCAQHLATAVQNGADIAAREGMALASLYGGMCLGPVNTAAVHALAYPLGGEYHVPHGLSNAVLLPEVFAFNAQASPDRHADVARALGVADGASDLETALGGAGWLRSLMEQCGLSTNLSAYGVRRDDVPKLAAAALTVKRLLNNNPRQISQDDAELLYESCLFPSA